MPGPLNFTLIGGEPTHSPDCFKLMGRGVQRRLYRNHAETDDELWSRVLVAADTANPKGHRSQLVVLCVYDLTNDDPRSDDFLNFERALTFTAFRDPDASHMGRVLVLYWLANLYGVASDLTVH